MACCLRTAAFWFCARSSDNIQGRTICALGDAAAMPVRAMIKHFREEFVQLIEHKAPKVAPASKALAEATA